MAAGLCLSTFSSQASDLGIQRGGFEQMEGIGFDPQGSEARYLRMTPDERKASLSRETKEVRIAEQYGLAYLPLMVMRQRGLIEKHANAAFLGEVDVTWVRYPSGEAMNNALRFGLLDFASGGVPPLLQVWDETYGDFGVKGVSPLSSLPMYLNVNRRDLKSLDDLTDSDRIALPNAAGSTQAITLQMAAARTFGESQYRRLDPLMVTMSHPDAMKALLSGAVAGHFGAAPYQYEELKFKNVHRLLTSFEVLDGPATMTALWTRSEFCGTNPKTCGAVVAAISEAIAFIVKEPRRAAEIYVVHTQSTLTPDQVYEMLQNPEIRYSMTPLRIMEYARFMGATGRLRNMPRDWREVFLPLLDVEGGS